MNTSQSGALVPERKPDQNKTSTVLHHNRSTMRHITIILLLLTLALHAVAQQWEPFTPPSEPGSVKKLRNLQNNVFLSHWDGVYRSADGGDHWQKVYDFVAIDYPLQLEVNRYNNRVYYAQSFDTSGNYGLYMSANMGSTWNYIGSSAAGPLAFIEDTLYSIWNYQSPDWFLSKKLGSGAWEPISTFPHDTAGSIYTLASQGQHLWVISGKGVYHSPDAGAHWELNLPLNDLPPMTGNPGKWVYIETLNDDLLIANEHAAKLYYSKDFGENWEVIPWTNRNLSNSGEHLYSMDPSGTQLLRFEGGNALNWTAEPTGSSEDINLEGVGEYQGVQWLGTFQWGVLRKKPGEDMWKQSNNNFGNPTIVGYHWENDLFSGIFTQTFSTDNGFTWEQRLSKFWLKKAWHIGNFNYGFPHNHPGRIYRCPRNHRYEWELISSVPTPISSVAILGDTVMALSGNVIYRSIDDCLTWNSIPSNGSAMLQTSKGKLYQSKSKSIYRSEDQGSTWQTVYTFSFPQSLSKFYIVRDTFLVSYEPEGKIYYSVDGGQSFNILDAPQNPNTTPYRFRANDGLLILDIGESLLYVSKDVGKTWFGLTPPNIYTGSVDDNTWKYAGGYFYVPDFWRTRLDDQRQASGKVFLDLNGNGQKEFNEKGLNDLMVINAQQQALTVSYKDGDFSTLLGQDAEALSIANVPTHYTVSPATVPVPAGGAILPPILFAIKPQGIVEDMAVNMTVASAFRSGYSNTLYVNAKNVGTVPKSGQLKLTLNPLLSTVSVTPAASLVIGDTLIWNYTNLGLLSELKVKIDFTTAIALPGTPVPLRAIVSGGLDVNPTNNIAIIAGQIVSSYDPNDKAVSETHVPINEADGEELVYTVRFQNLGNIATDFITVHDTLSESIDANTVQVLASSHPYELKIEDGHILVFRFNPIRLAPAAEDTIESQGFLQFTARLKPGLEVGDEIANTAHIYFDFNPAVVTNTVNTQISVVSTFEPSRKTQAMEIFPNPASGRVTLRLPESINGNGRIEIFSVEGKVVHVLTAQGNTQEIELPGNVPVGTYWCRWWAEGKVYWGKLSVAR